MYIQNGDGISLFLAQMERIDINYTAFYQISYMGRGHDICFLIVAPPQLGNTANLLLGPIDLVLLEWLFDRNKLQNTS
jgi:hypothetical protein